MTPDIWAIDTFLVLTGLSFVIFAIGSLGK